MTNLLINHLWQSTVFALAAALLALAFRKSRAHVRYSLWFMASVKFLVPFALLTTIGSHVHAPQAQQAMRVNAPYVSSMVVQMTEPFPSFSVSAPAPRKPDANGKNTATITLSLVWALGFAAITFARVRAWLRLRRVLRANKPLEIPIPIPETIRVISVPGLLEPGVIGWLSPTLMLPADIGQRLGSRELDAVIAHELCHVRRRDNLTSAIHMFVEAVFWFHPLVWWIGNQLLQERERACDEEVLRMGNEPLIYAEGILQVCKIYLESPLRCVSGVTGSDLKQRIHAVLAGRVGSELTPTRKTLLAISAAWAVAVPLIVGVLHAGAFQIPARPADTPKWEVVSVKPCPAFNSGTRGAGGGGGRGGGGGGGPALTSPGNLNLNCGPFGTTVSQMITQAYVTYVDGHNITRFRTVGIQGGPAWVNSDRYEIRAKAGNDAAPETMMRGPMLQALLEDRFKLRIHAESREVPVYALTLSKGGLKLQKLEDGYCEPPGPSPRPMRMTPDVFEEFLKPGQKPGCSLVGISSWGPGSQNQTVHGQAMSMAQFANTLSRGLDRPVIDQTGVAGIFNFHLKFAQDQATVGFLPPPLPGINPPPLPEAASEPAGASIFTAIQDQLGLKLEQTRGPGEFLVIDSIERPSEN
jgi:bla regulator protein blaR1